MPAFREWTPGIILVMSAAFLLKSSPFVKLGAVGPLSVVLVLPQMLEPEI